MLQVSPLAGWTERGGLENTQVGAGIGQGSSGASAPWLQGGLRSPATQPDVDAPAAPPPWVQTVRATAVWSASAGGERVASVGQWRFLRVNGAEEARFRVAATEPDASFGQAWIDLDDVGLSGPPPEGMTTVRAADVFTSPDAIERRGVVPARSDLIVAGGQHGHRVYVYVPGAATEKVTGYGWVEVSALARADRRPDVPLPSPALRLPSKARSGVYRVGPGDSVASISAAVGLGAHDLLRLNDLEGAAGLMVGQTLRVPEPAGQGPSEAPRKVRDISPGWVSAEHAVVIDGASGQVLWGREANSQVAPASLTKIVTALVALEHARLADLVKVRVDSREMPDSTVMGLFPGEEVSVEDLLYGLMLPSGNDAAVALAEHVAGTREAFARLMNEKARSLGLAGSIFVNPHGLDASGHVSTAYDMAMLAREGLRNPVFQALSVARTYETPRGKGYQLFNLNQLLWRYTGADGVKIGYTDAAGRTIVGSATQDGHRVIVSMMRSQNIYADSAALLDWAFAAHEW